MQADLSRLEKLYFRLEAQYACFDWVFARIAATRGPIFELGLGKGRTYDHLRRRLPDHDIYVFERDVGPIADCMPPEEFLVRGDVAETLPVYVEDFAGQVVLAHSDMGDFSEAHNREMRKLVTKVLPRALAPGGYILSDLDLDLPGFEAVPLPQGARQGRYFIFRKPLNRNPA
jgi:hypothetical protein